MSGVSLALTTTESVRPTDTRTTHIPRRGSNMGAEAVSVPECTPPSDQQIIEAVTETRKHVYYRLNTAGMVDDFDDVIAEIHLRLYKRMVGSPRAGDNPGAYVWKVADGIINDHIAKVAQRRRSEPVISPDLLDGGYVHGSYGRDDSPERRHAIHIAELTLEAVGAEVWEKVAHTVSVSRAMDPDPAYRAHRNLIDRVRRTARVIEKALELAQKNPHAVEIDIAAYCLPDRQAEVIVKQHLGAPREEIGALFGLKTSESIRKEISRANTLLRHAMTTYDDAISAL